MTPKFIEDGGDYMKLQTKTPIIYPISVPTRSDLATFNFYLVENQDQLLLVDAGINSEKCWQAFLDVLRKNDFILTDIDKIVLTHSHEDHTGLVNHILDKHQVSVYAHEDAVFRLKRDWGYLKRRLDFFQELYAKAGSGAMGDKRVEVLKRKARENSTQAIHTEIILLKEGDAVNGFKVIATPGHWPDHIVLLDPENGIMLSGDHLIQHISSNALIEPDQQGQKIATLLQYEQSLMKCQSYHINIIYPGHGEIIHAPSKLIEQRLNGIERKAKKILSTVGKLHPCTVAEIAQVYYKDKYDTEFSLVMSEILGQLDRLEAQKRIERQEKDGKWYYSVND